MKLYITHVIDHSHAWAWLNVLICDETFNLGQIEILGKLASFIVITYHKSENVIWCGVWWIISAQKWTHHEGNAVMDMRLQKEKCPHSSKGQVNPKGISWKTWALLKRTIPKVTWGIGNPRGHASIVMR